MAAADLSELPEVPRVEGMAVKPGDYIVLSFKKYLDDSEYASITEGAKNWGLPAGVRVIVLDGDASLRVLSGGGE